MIDSFMIICFLIFNYSYDFYKNVILLMCNIFFDKFN